MSFREAWLVGWELNRLHPLLAVMTRLDSLFPLTPALSLWRERFPRKCLRACIHNRQCVAAFSLSSSGGEGWGEDAFSLAPMPVTGQGQYSPALCAVTV